MIRVAAVADVHFGEDSAGSLRPHLEHLPERADALLLAGDLTRHGRVDEAAVLAAELDGLPVPVLAVLGNHDYHCDEQGAIATVLETAGITVLEGEGTVIEVAGARLAVAGTKGFGGGFAGACGTDFGEAEMKAFIRHTKSIAGRLEATLGELRGDVRIALLHYSPVPDTLLGERLEIYPFLGSYLLGEAIDSAGANLVLHGHAHAGSERGETPGGIPVRNVALPVIRRAYTIFCFDAPQDAAQTGFGSPIFSELSH